MPWYTALDADDPFQHLGRVSQGRIQTRCSLSLARHEARLVSDRERDQAGDACPWCLAREAYPPPDDDRDEDRPRRPRHRRRRDWGAALADALTTFTIIAVVASVAAVVLAVIGIVALWVLR